MLQKPFLQTNIDEALGRSEQAQARAREQIKQLKADIGQSLTHEQFQEAARSIRDEQTGGLTTEVVRGMAQATAGYLNKAQDLTGDRRQTDIQPPAVRPMFEALTQFGGQESRSIAAVDSRVQAAWQSTFPWTFQLATPPPGSIRKTSSVGAPAPIGSMAPVMNAGSRDAFVANLARVIHTAASSVTVTIQHGISTSGRSKPNRRSVPAGTVCLV
jgi:hypothetical protein